jgi:hypothetical protein
LSELIRARSPRGGRLIRSIDDLTLDAHTPFAVIVRRDIRLNARTLEPPLTRVVRGTGYQPAERRFVYIFNCDEIRLLADAAVREQQGLAPRRKPDVMQTADERRWGCHQPADRHSF